MQAPEIADGARLARVPAAHATLFRQTLERAGYTDTNVSSLLGALEMPTRRARNLPRLRRSSAGESTLSVLVRLLFLGLPVEEDQARSALAPSPLQKWLRAGLLAAAGGNVRALVRIVPYSGVLLAMDPPESIETGARPDVVVGMTGSSLTLLYFTIRRWFPSVLDLGTGTGIQALVAAGHAGKVLATDVARRSADFARFNAKLNGRTNIEFAVGDGFGAAGRRRFDLIVSNPPFMISPGRRYEYRDSGIEGDGFCRRIAQEAPNHLREGGYFQMTCEWIHPRGQDWQERLAGWFQNSGCDVLVLRSENKSPALYADDWIRDTEQDNPELGAQLYEEYLEYYRRLGIQSISNGMIALRRRSAVSNHIRFEEMPPQKPEPFGNSVLMHFDLADALELLVDDRHLLAQRLRLAPHLLLEQQLLPSEGNWRVEGARLRLARGIQFQGNVDEYACRLVVKCTGQAQLAEIVAGIAAELGVDFERVAEPSLKLARDLVARGFLLPEGMEWPAATPPAGPS